MQFKILREQGLGYTNYKNLKKFQQIKMSILKKLDPYLYFQSISTFPLVPHHLPYCILAYLIYYTIMGLLGKS